MSSLICIACDQIDCAGPAAITAEGQRERFAQWNLTAGKQSYHQSNSRAALYYYSKGIAFLGDECKENWDLCLELHKGALRASFLLGEPDNIMLYSEKIVSNVQFEDTLDIQPMILRSLSQAGKHEEAISRGIDVLRRLGFDLPLAPDPGSVMKAMATTQAVASKYSVDQMMSLCEKDVEESVERVLTIMDAFYSSCYASTSPFLPLVACTIIQYSFQNGICMESLMAFATLAMLKVFFVQDYAGGRQLGDLVIAMEKKHRSGNKKVNDSHARIMLYVAVDIWFENPRAIAQKLDLYHQNCRKSGQLDMAMVSIGVFTRYQLLGGGNLSLLKQTYDDKFPMVAKHSPFVAKYIALDSLLLSVLTGGKSGDFFSVFNGSICNMNDIQDEAKSNKDMTLLQSSHVFCVMIEYWRGNHTAAEAHSSQASIIFPASKEPTIYNQFHALFRGLVLFALYRQEPDNSKRRLDRGKEMMDQVGKWAEVSEEVFGNKWYLLQAEYSASLKSDDAKQFYETSIRAAKDHGNIHELGLALELYGDYQSSLGCMADAHACYESAYMYYFQWGANAVAEKLMEKHSLDLNSADDSELKAASLKRTR